MARRDGRYPEQPHPPGRDFDDEQDVQPAEQHGVDMGEVACQDALGLGGQEPPPRLGRPSRRGVDPGLPEDQPDRGWRYPVAEADQFAVDSVAAAAGLFVAMRSISCRIVGFVGGLPPRYGTVHRRRRRFRCQRSTGSSVTNDRAGGCGEQPAQRSLHSPVCPGRAGSGDLPAQHCQLVAKDQDFGVL
jgi:hypothetical protein